MIEQEPVSFCSVLHFPHPANKKIKRISRIVVKPDYQGIGIGGRTLDFVSNKLKRDGWDVRIVTSLAGFISNLAGNNNWSLYRHDRVCEGRGTFNGLLREHRSSRKTAAFKYIG
jgi:GNAT superfamily N-acetyltransferase